MHEPVERVAAQHLDRVGAGRVLPLLVGLALDQQLLPLLVLGVLVPARPKAAGVSGVGRASERAPPQPLCGNQAARAQPLRAAWAAARAPRHELGGATF